MWSQFLFTAYWLLLIPVLIYAIKVVFRRGDWKSQASAGLVLIPIVLRLMLLK